MQYLSPPLLFLFAFIGCTSLNFDSTSIDAKPNIIYILADDLGYGDVGAYGQTKIETPNIDALAKGGMLFTQHYTGAPVCAPARAVLLTGKHMGHVYIRGNDEWAERGNVWDFRAAIMDSTLEGQRPLPASTITLPMLLKASGYRTGMIGKWGLGAPHSNSVPTKMGFDYFFGYNCQRQAHTFYPVHLYENEQRVYYPNDTIVPGTGINREADYLAEKTYKKYSGKVYAPEVSFEKIIGFLESNRNQPFFLYWATPIPHLPLQAPKRWVDYYVKKFGDEKPYYFVQGESGGSYFPNRYPRATYAAMISYLDENIGKLVAYLKKENLYNNTLIIFTSDNGPTYTGGTDSRWFESAGPFRSEYGRGKGFLHEGGIRVPMIAHWPEKIKPGSTSDHISAFWDVLPTLCEAAKTSIPKDSDGISFLKALTGDPTQQTHEYLYWEFPEYNGQVAVRMGKWKLLWKEMKKANKEVELYDLEHDIEEQNNIARLHPEIVKKLASVIKKEHQSPEIARFRIEALEEVYNQK